MHDLNVAFLSVVELVDAYQRRRLSPVEVVHHQLARIERLNPTLKAYLLVDGDRAVDQARKAERELGSKRGKGLLVGVPVAHKDIYFTRGLRTTAHSQVLADFVPDYDATVVARWRKHGAISLGKLNTHEFACGGMEFFGYTANPHDPGRISGGSSSGSAVALAAGLCFGATGTDTGGSIRNPSSFCGLAGLKPTYGRASRHGVLPLAWSLDHCGPMARTVADCALLLRAMAGYDPNDATSARIPVPDYMAHLTGDCHGLRMGIPRGWFFEAIGLETAAAIEESASVLRHLGGQVEEMVLDHLPEVAAAHGTIMMSEAYAAHEQWLATRAEQYGQWARERILQGGLYTAAEYLRARRMRTLFVKYLELVFQVYDVLIVPTTLEPAHSSSQFGRYENEITRPARPGALAGIPCLSVPCGYTSDGMPVGLQIMGRWWDEATVLRVGHAFEQATGWHRLRPAVAS